ncbi:hypothetical protein JXA31_08295 [Candidatus Bathyarchaeota archaeon]|nr:hypothetical protein [Candidatus Bathyarchaeota archaeon]
MELGPLSNEEIAEVVNQFPNLKNLASKEHLKEILSRPFILDILTLPNITVPQQFAPSQLSEVWLMDWYWKEVVRLAERMRRGAGNPDTREELLIRLAMHSLIGKPFDVYTNNLDAEAVSGLVSDRLLVKEGNRLRFAHDVLEDWTLTALLSRHKNEMPKYLLELGDPLRLVRPFRLHASRLLELDNDQDSWLNLLTMLSSNRQLSSRWYQIALTTPLFSPLLTRILHVIKPSLLANNGALLSELLKAVRTVCVETNPTVYSLLGDLPPEELDKYLAYWTIPAKEQWLPIIEFMLQNPSVIKEQILDEFSYIAEKWMNSFIGQDKLLRKETASLCLNILNEGLLKKYTDEPKNRYILSLLYGAECLPDQISDFVLNKAVRNRENDEYGFEELILEQGWIPLCRFIPETALKVLGEILCVKIRPQRFGSYEFMSFDNLGIKDTHWIPPTYLEGPFLVFLRLDETKGLELIHKVVNHATFCWRKRESAEANRTPTPQKISLNHSTIEVWGDELVYGWYRFPSVAPDAVTCALMALEHWMNEQLEKNKDPAQLFECVLKDTTSAAVVGVCSSVALANPNICREIMVPILENPAFWLMDYRRLVNDLSAESTTYTFSLYFSFGGRRDMANYKILLELAKQPHRRSAIEYFILPILLFSPPQVQDRLKKAMHAFQDNPPVFFENEKDNQSLMEERKKDCELWSVRADIENYHELELNGRVGIEFKLPENLEKEQKERLRLTEEKNKLYSFLGWAMNLLDKDELGQAFTVESAIEYAQTLAYNDNPNYPPVSFLEDSEMRAQAIAAFVASILVRRFLWAKEKGYLQWLREQLLVAAKRPEPMSKEDDKVSKYPMGYRRSAARALWVLLKENPKDKEVRKVALNLSSHVNDEVKMHLFNGLKMLWLTNQKIIWKCIQNCIRISYTKNCQKPIKHCLPTDVDTDSLKSVLYCVPTGSEINQITESNRLADFLEELLLFTLNAYDCYQEKNHYNAWDHNEWNNIIFQIVANFALHLPQHIAESKFYRHILNSWRNKPAVMQTFLRSLLLVGCKPELEDELAELWPQIGENILSSVQQNNIESYHDEIKNIIGLLIFVDPAGIITWNIQEWKPLKQLVPFINRWYETFGHDSVHFRTLILFFKTIGFNLFPEMGVSLLFDCVSKLDDIDKTLNKTSYVLSELLCLQWSMNCALIAQNGESMRQFTFIVDMLASRGEARALQLQSKLQNLPPQ